MNDLVHSDSGSVPIAVLADAVRPFACAPIFADDDSDELELVVSRRAVIRLCSLAGVDPHIGYLDAEQSA